jgi:hypothetical protein
MAIFLVNSQLEASRTIDTSLRATASPILDV